MEPKTRRSELPYYKTSHKKKRQRSHLFTPSYPILGTQIKQITHHDYNPRRQLSARRKFLQSAEICVVHAPRLEALVQFLANCVQENANRLDVFLSRALFRIASQEFLFDKPLHQ